MIPTLETSSHEERKRIELEQLVAGCLDGERQAQLKLYQQFYNQVFAVCCRYASDRDEAKSLVNTTFLKAFQNLGNFSFTGSFGGWLTRIAINACIDEVRKRTKELKRTVTMENLPEVAISNHILESLTAEDIIAALQKLPQVSRTVFSLYVLDGFKHAEIAKMLHMQEATSRWHLANAKKDLQVLLKNYER